MEPIELQIDPETGMKNYIANGNLGIATSAGYVKFSFTRSIHFGRVYTSGERGSRGKEADLCEALRCLGQGLHCLEDFGAHTNYTELALREMGYRDVFPHAGTATELDLHGHRVFPLVTGTFGVVDFIHSVLGEATDHFAQTEVEQMDIALKEAEAQSKAGDGSRSSAGSGLSSMTGLLSQVPGAGDLARQAGDLQAQSEHQEQENRFEAPPGSEGGPPGPNIPGTNLDPMKTAAQIYPILEFRDKVVKIMTATIEKIPGLEALVEKITETLTLFVLSLLAPFIRPIINAVSKQLKAGSGGVIDASGKHQYEPWTDPHCSDPTHSLLSKDHFSNILNEPAGQVASFILQYVAPRVIYAWQHPDVPVEQVLNDIIRVFHHPALRDHRCELHQNMYSAVERWAHGRPDGGSILNVLLGSDSVRHGSNHTVDASEQSHTHGGLPSSVGNFFGAGSHSKVRGAPWETLGKVRDNPDIGPGSDTSAAGSTTCPSCNGSTKGLTEQVSQDCFIGIEAANNVQQQISEHVNECLDGKARPLPQDVAGAFPGTQTAYDDTRPSTGPEFGYSNQTGQQAQEPYLGAQQQFPLYSQQDPQSYGQPPQWQPGCQAPPEALYPSQGGYPPQPPKYGYSGGPAYGYNPNAPPPPQPYSYGPPPPGPHYGGGPY